MTKKPSRKSNQPGDDANGKAVAHKRGVKSSAIRTYLTSHKKAMPKEVVAALKTQGIDVSPNMVSIIKAKLGIRKAKRNAQRALDSNDASAVAQSDNAAGLDAALTLYKAARGQSNVSAARVQKAFLALIEHLG